MKTARLLLAASALFATSCAFAQSYPATPVPPPPGLDDPGVKPAPAATAATPAHGQALDLKPQALPAAGVGQRPADDSLPEIRVRQDGDDTIQEYSRNGRVYMVVVTPRSGISQTYMVDPQGRWVDEHGQKPVRPVMYKLLEWGKSRPPADDTDSSDGH